jgi:nucleotide-binding universal stress UspA family protein
MEGVLLESKIYKNILIATDGSDYSAKAVKHGVEIARMSGSKVFGLFVVDTGAFASIPMDMAWGNIYEMLKSEGEKATGFVEEQGQKENVEVECIIVDGHPAEEIVEFSRKNSIDLIIMGTLGKGGLDRFLLGSIAEKVLRNAKVPVMIVRSEK